jgi:hypothetical protein
LRVSATSDVEFPYPCLERAHARGVRCRLVQHQERPILIVLHGRQRKTGTHCQFVHPLVLLTGVFFKVDSRTSTFAHNPASTPSLRIPGPFLSPSARPSSDMLRRWHDPFLRPSLPCLCIYFECVYITTIRCRAHGTCCSE